MISWLSENIIEIFGAVTGIAYVFLEIKRNILLWPLGILTSAVYIYVFGRNGFYSNMGLQVYYLVISIYGWMLWHGALLHRQPAVTADKAGGTGHGEGEESDEQKKGVASDVRRVGKKTALACLIAIAVLWAGLWFALDRWTDSPVPEWDGLITSLSVVATWMLTKKYLEQWYVWIVADAIAVIVYAATGLYATTVLFVVYTVMAVIGVRAWSREQGAWGMGHGEERREGSV